MAASMDEQILRAAKEIIVKFIETGRIVGGQIHDARIAALCHLHEVKELWTADRDFSRFAGINVRNPLIKSQM